MNNSVTQAELEDVLSAIRRLVAEDRTQPGAPSPEAASRDKLVLTPALRVHEHREELDCETGAPSGSDAVADTDDAIASSADPGDGAQDVESEMPRPESLLHAGVDHTQAGDAGSDVVESTSHDGAVAAPGSGLSMADSSGVVPSAPDPGEDASDPHDDVGADAGGSDDNLAATEGAEILHPEDVAQRSDECVDKVAMTEAPLQDRPLGVDRATRASTLESKIAELEAMVGMSGGWEPEEGDTPPFAPTDEFSSDLDAKQPDVDQAEDALDPEETVLDEDMLRAMVQEIVRQELQGELGERITRNVRKLVRREIHRALAAQLFE